LQQTLNIIIIKRGKEKAQKQEMQILRRAKASNGQIR
jgi:hypothetical protein